MSWCRPSPGASCPVPLPELSFALADPNNELTAQFSSILNLPEIFGPLLPLEPELVFFAPLRSNLTDLRGAPAAYERDGDAIYRDAGGRLRVAASGAARFSDLAIMLEPASTNRCTNYNANPDAALTNVNQAGDPALVITRVQEPGALAAAGLELVCDSGYVFQADNTGGSGNGLVNIVGNSEGGVLSSLSAWARQIAGFPSGQLQFSNGAGTVNFENSAFERIVTDNSQNTALAGAQFVVAPGRIIQFVLNGMESLFVASSEVITRGATASRGGDSLMWTEAGFWSDAEGMALLEWRPAYSGSDYPAGVRLDSVLLTRRLSAAGNPVVNFSHRSTGQILIESNGDGVQTDATLQAADIQAGVRYPVAVRWKTSPSQKQIGIKLAGGWQWSSQTAYGGQFQTDGVLRLMGPPNKPMAGANLQIWSEDRGVAWIEANYP